MSNAPSTSWANWAWQAYKDGRLVDAPALPAVQPDAREAALHELADDLEALADDLCHLSEAARFNLHTRAAGIRNALVALIDKPAVQPVREEVMPDVEDTQHTRPDAAPASTAYAGGGAWDAMLYGMGVTLGGQHVPIDKVFAVAPPDREEVAEALWRADQYQGQIRSRFADIESYNRNHWLMMADVAIEKIKGGKK